jgi:DNA-binding NtrC family response regulator
MTDERVENLPGMIGRHPLMLELYELAALVAPTELPALIIGETGTGKELVARALHQLSPRVSGPLISVNCAAIPETLAEAELFGVERGAYTGADRARPGRVELADGGTLFLDEVCSAPLTVQAKLLRTVELGEFWRVGGSHACRAACRVIAAVSSPVSRLVTTGRLREDLAFRLAVVELVVPPLRERRGDVPALVAHFSGSLNGGGGRGSIAPDALALLCGYRWPGNVRQLQATMERLMLLSRGHRIEASLVRRVLGIRELSSADVARALAEARGSVRAAARSLGVPRTTLRRLLQSDENSRQSKVGLVP